MTMISLTPVPGSGETDNLKLWRHSGVIMNRKHEAKATRPERE